MAGGEFVEPSGELNATAVAQLVKLAPAAGDATADWSAFNSMCVSVCSHTFSVQAVWPGP